MSRMWDDTPCELCGATDGCTCPPCPCKWCRSRRGEPLTEWEAAEIRRHERELSRVQGKIPEKLQ